MNKARVQQALAPLKGKIFADREALEDAVFPLFGPLQPIFEGEGHRDLVDRLIGALWITRSNVGFTVVLEDPKPAKPIELPQEFKATPVEVPVPSTAPIPDLTYNELGTILEIFEVGSVPTSRFALQESLLNSLLSKGLVVQIDELSSERTHDTSSMETAKGRAFQQIANNDFAAAIGTLQFVMSLKEKLDTNHWVYKLTPLGLAVQAKLSNAKIKID